MDNPTLPKNWQRFSDEKLTTLRAELSATLDNLEERRARRTTPEHDDGPDLEELDDAISNHDYAINDIDDEMYERRHPNELIDYDEQDRRAASEERIENHRRER